MKYIIYGRNRKTAHLALFLSLLLSCAAWAGDKEAETDQNAEANKNAAEDSQELPEAEDGLSVKNEWDFVESSMDISGGIPENAGGRLERIRETGVLTVATEPYFAPQEFIDPTKNGQDQYVGSDMEMAKRIAQRMEAELVIVPLEFTEVLEGMIEGKYDLAISGLAYTPGRARSMELSKGYYFTDEEAAVGLLIREEDKDLIKGIADLSDKNIIAQSGSLQEAVMAENVTAYREFRRVPSVQDVYLALEHKETDAGMTDVDTAKQYIRKNPDCHLMLVPGVEFSLEEECKGDRVAAPLGETELICFVNGVIDELLQSGEYDKWYDEYTEFAAQLEE
ncbi:MAG: transporter substrate-binding domain-containing protein [Blautia sp.]|nr:transporter substrate-binding domain-containing protein [Blautia sp.]